MDIEIEESIEERIARDGWESLSRPERLYYGVWWLSFVAGGPGLEQYFGETPDAQIEAAREGLRELGAIGSLAILDEARGLSPWRPVPPGMDDADPRVAAILANQEKWSDASRRFTDEPYPGDLLQAYFERNESSFTGPRTALELWQSKVARGADTTPRYVSKAVDFEKEAELDRPNSSRSCPHCGYPTPDYRPRCKRCDYPHGRA
jgi:hypothetical protein